MPIKRSTLTQDVTLHATRLWSIAAAAAEVQVEHDHRVPDGPPRAGGGPKLKDSFEFDRTPRRRGRRLVGTARNTAPHAQYTVRGTSPHTIRARRARALRFEDGGQVVFARSVNHPGTEPSSWWDDVLADAWPRSLQAAALLL